MTFSYNIGLTVGSIVAYLLDALVGERISNPCGFNSSIEAISSIKNISSYTLGLTTTTSTSIITPGFSKSTETLTSTAISILNSTLSTITDSSIISATE